MVRMPHWPVPIWHREIELGLKRMQKICNYLQDPQDKMPNVIHIAGTNGKGSTIALMRAILEAAGKSVNVYISPHILRFNERITIEGNEISDQHLYEIMEETRLANDIVGVDLTFFEGTTVGAFLAFSRSKADYTLIETGLGGRLDPTNLIENKLMTVITPISLDHTDFLGSTLALIAREKAEIMRSQIPAIISQQYPEVAEVLFHKAEMLGTNYYSFEYDFGAYKNDDGFTFKDPNHTLNLPMPALVGEHQIINAATAIAAILHLPNENISPEIIARGLRQAKWAGRLQKLDSGHLTKLLPNNDWELWIDGAHNQAGAHVLALWAEDRHKPIYILGGLTKGRNISEFFEKFRINNLQFITSIYIENEASSYPSQVLSDKLNEIGLPAIPANSIEEAILEIVKHQPGIILACGSLYLAGEILHKNYGMHY